MFSRNVGLFSGLALTLLIFSAEAEAAERAERTLTHEETVAEGTTFSLDNLIGSITVEGGGAKGKVRIEARVVAEAETRQDAQGMTESIDLVRRAEGAGALIHVAYPVEQYTAFRLPKSEGQGLLSKWVSPLLRRSTVAAEYDGRTVEVGNSRGAAAVAVHLTVTVPYDIHASFKQIVGSIHCARSRGRMTLENVQGEVHAVQVYGALHARTGGGGVTVKTFKGEELSLQTGSGDMELMDVNAKDARLRTGSGRIQGSLITAAALRVETASGDVKLEDVEPATLDVSTGSGSVDLATRLKGTREASIQSGSGNVTLRVGSLTSFDLKAKSESGSVKTRGVSVEVLQEDEHGARLKRRSGATDLRVTTGSGDLILRPL